MKEQLTIIHGKGIIGTIEYQNKAHALDLLFHGSPQTQGLLEPQDVFWQRDGIKYSDSEFPVVCAMASTLIPIFMAIVPRGKGPVGYDGNEEGGVDFFIDTPLVNSFTSGKGLVSAFDNDGLRNLLANRQKIGQEELFEDHMNGELTNLYIQIFMYR